MSIEDTRNEVAVDSLHRQLTYALEQADDHRRHLAAALGLDHSSVSLAALVSMVASLTAENERLRRQLEHAQLGEQKYRSVCKDLQAEVERLRKERDDLGAALDREHQIEQKHLVRALDAERAIARAQPVLEAAKEMVRQRNEHHGNPSNPDWWKGWDFRLVAAVDTYETTREGTEGAGADG